MRLTLFKETDIGGCREAVISEDDSCCFVWVGQEGPSEEGEEMSLVGVRVGLGRTRGKTFQKGHKPCSGKTPELQAALSLEQKNLPGHHLVTDRTTS